MLAVHVAGGGQRKGKLYCDLQVLQLMLWVGVGGVVIVHQAVVLKIILCNSDLPFFSDLLGDEEGAAISKPCFSPLVRMTAS